MKHHTVAIITIVFVLLSIVVGGGSGATDIPGGEVLEGHAANVAGRAFDWDGWDRDLDNDHVDDILTTGIPVVEAVEGTIGINVHFTDGVDEGSISGMIGVAEGLGLQPELVYSGKYSTAQYLRVRHLDLSAYRALASFAGVTMVEYRPWMVPFLDTSTKGIRASPSTEYSPYTASELGYTGEGVNIAMMDSGADDIQHESLRGKFVTGGDFTGLVTVNNVNPKDEDGHGTHTAGIALGSGGQSTTYAGVAPGSGLVDLRIFRFFGGDASNSDHAFEWLIENHSEHDIRVVSCSFGSTYSSSGKDTTSRLVNQLVDEGVVVVVAAGNDGTQGLPSPAAADKAITVGALNDKGTVTRNDDGYASYSNYGPRSSDGDSDQMDELKPDILASGTDIRSAQYNTVMAYSEKTGTSMSCPHVSGAVALMFEANPNLTPDQVKQIIRETAQRSGSGSRPDLDDRYNYRSGWGLIDVYGAVKRSEELASYQVDGPAEVIGGETIDLELSGEFSRTDLTSHTDHLSIEIRIPKEWGPIEDVDLDAGSPSGTSSLDEPILIGSMWRVKGSIAYDQPLVGIEPILSLRIEAPMEMGSRANIQGLISINGMEGSVRALNITVSSEADPADLSIIPVAIWFSSNRPDSGDDVEITVKVNNTGGTTVQNVLIRLLDGPVRTGALIGEEESTISPGGSGIVSFTWEASAGVHAITAVADPDDVITETNELNNSAERPITVLGINPPPVAELTADRTSTNTLTEVTFDGSGSQDTNVRGGAVTQYLFDFGDGETSGWVNLSSVQHRYRDAGSFRAALTVKDNGGASSSNDAFVVINVTQQATDSTRLYLLNSSSLSEDVGEKGSTEIPMITDGVEYIGTWISPAMERSLVLHSRIKMRLELMSGEDGMVDVEAQVLLSDETIVLSGEMEVTSTLPNYFEAEAVIGDIRLDRGGEITLEIFAGSNTSSSSLITGGPGSYIEILHYPVTTGTPIADAGPDREVKAQNAVTFTGQAQDEDGEIISVRWDV
ncbi:MAG: S8 family serine peptidase, partial [Thermoplasmata archaeon]|nr:S8 family serine peptidase [Thermoplasmata archaeon]